MPEATRVDRFEVVEAALADLDQVQQLALGLFRDPSSIGDPHADERWALGERGRAFFAAGVDDDDQLLLVARAGDRTVGYLRGGLVPLTDWRPVPRSELMSFYVEPRLRSRGIGRRMTDGFLQWSRDHGASVALVSSYADNDAGIRFYRSMGFQPYSLELEVQL